MTTLLLVRHGATAWNHEGRLQGRTDVPLSAEGVAQARALRPLIDAWAPRTAISSTLCRASQTAALLTDLPVTTDRRLIETSLGRWEGRRAEDIGPEVPRWRRGELIPPGGEDPASSLERLGDFLEDLPGTASPVLVVTHGGVVRLLLDHLVALRLKHMEAVAPASITAVELATPAARLRQFNVTTAAG